MKKIITAFVTLLLCNIVLAQNVGIGTSTPVKGKLVVRGTVGAVSAIFGDTTSGIAIENSFPGIAFNSYYNGGRQPLKNGFGGVMGLNPENGDFHIYTSPMAGTTGNALGTNLRLLINKDGNIGLQGISDPAMPLSFAGTTGNKIALWGTDDSMHYGMGIQGSLFQLYAAASDNDIAFGYGSSVKFKENMRIKGNGFVGIGTIAPAYPLTLAKEGNGFVQKGTSVEIGTATTASAGILKTYTNHPLQFATGNAAPQMALTYSGRIGLGTTAPSTKVEIKHNDFDVLQLTNSNPLASGENISMTFRTGSSYTGSISTIGTSATTARMALATGNFLTERVSITNDGNVGINNTNPQAKLEVNGLTVLNPAPGEQTAAVVNGRMKFTGAAFKLVATQFNVTLNPSTITIDNPVCNNNPNVMLMVTPLVSSPMPYTVGYNDVTKKWFIRTTSNPKVTGYTVHTYADCDGSCYLTDVPTLGDYYFTQGDAFNVLVIEY